jgi:thioredoxin-like negative regulator of GroEL
MNKDNTRLLAIAAALVFGGCGSRQPQAPVKYAVLRFENLTQDRNLDWVGRAASEVLTKAVSAIPLGAIYQAQQPSIRRPVSAPGISTEVSGAKLAGATRVISGYYELVQGKLVFTAVEEDAATGKTLKNASASGDVLPAAEALARQFVATPKPYSTRSEAALRSTMVAIEAASPGEEMFRKALAADPKYSEAYIGLAEVALARKDRATLDDIVSQARTHNLDASTQARLELAASTLSPDLADRERALNKLAAADPSDKTVLRGIADSEFASHRFPEAAGHYARVADADHPDAYNLLAYARMFGGEEKAAIEASQQYQKLRPEDPNAIDTQGDIEYFFSRYADAEKSYLRAGAKDANFNHGGESWKAARARLMTGDVAGASELFSRYSAERTRAKDPTIGYRAAEWQYLTGARAKGIAEMLKAADAAPNPALQTLAQAQAAVWELQNGKRKEATRDAELVIRAGQNPRLVPAALARFAALEPPASADEWRKRAESVFRGDGGAQLRTLAVAYALFAAGQYAEAAPVWKNIFLAANPNDQSPQFFYAGALKQSGHEQEAAALLKGNPIPSTNLAASFESFYFPRLFDWRGDHATFLKLLPAGIAEPAK